MMLVVIEMFRDGAWKPVGGVPDVQVSATVDSGPVVTITAGHIRPPWRVRCNEEILFERSQ